MKKRGGLFLKALVSFIILSIIVIVVSLYILDKINLIIGFAFLGLGIISLIFLKIFKIKINSIYPDIIFGLIDNGVLVFAAVLGGYFAGVIGAIIGGVAGNTITDGAGGLFEGRFAEKQRKKNIKTDRTALSASLGKMTGCLFGAGIGLIILWLINLI